MRKVKLGEGHEPYFFEFDEKGEPIPIDLREELRRLERAIINQAISAGKGSVTEMARLLKIKRTTLNNRIDKLGIMEEDDD